MVSDSNVFENDVKGYQKEIVFVSWRLRLQSFYIQYVDFLCLMYCIAQILIDGCAQTTTVSNQFIFQTLGGMKIGV